MNENELYSMYRSGTVDETEIVKKLVHDIHERNVDIASLKMQLSHSKLQVQALLSREKSYRSDINQLEFAHSTSEQDNVILQMKIKEMAMFEGRDEHPGFETVESTRGKLLQAANCKIAELSNELRNSAEQLILCEQNSSSVHTQLLSNNQSLRIELDQLSAQLAQRTLLYAAQERRAQDNSRIHQSQFSEQTSAIITLRAQLQQLELQNSRTDKEKMEYILSNQQLKTNLQNIEVELRHSLERQSELESDLAEASTVNMQLQSTVELLRGTDFEDLEHSLMQQLEDVRRDAHTREQSLQLQLADVNKFVEQQANRREELTDEIRQLKNELYHKTHLLDEIKNSGLVVGTNWNNINNTISSELKEYRNFLSPHDDDNNYSTVVSNSRSNTNPIDVYKQQNDKFKEESSDNESFQLNLSTSLNQNAFLGNTANTITSLQQQQQQQLSLNHHAGLKQQQMQQQRRRRYEEQDQEEGESDDQCNVDWYATTTAVDDDDEDASDSSDNSNWLIDHLSQLHASKNEDFTVNKVTEGICINKWGVTDNNNDSAISNNNSDEICNSVNSFSNEMWTANDFTNKSISYNKSEHAVIIGTSIKRSIAEYTADYTPLLECKITNALSAILNSLLQGPQYASSSCSTSQGNVTINNDCNNMSKQAQFLLISLMKNLFKLDNKIISSLMYKIDNASEASKDLDNKTSTAANNVIDDRSSTTSGRMMRLLCHIRNSVEQVAPPLLISPQKYKSLLSSLPYQQQQHRLLENSSNIAVLTDNINRYNSNNNNNSDGHENPSFNLSSSYLFGKDYNDGNNDAVSSSNELCLDGIYTITRMPEEAAVIDGQDGLTTEEQERHSLREELRRLKAALAMILRQVGEKQQQQQQHNNKQQLHHANNNNVNSSDFVGNAYDKNKESIDHVHRLEMNVVQLTAERDAFAKQLQVYREETSHLEELAQRNLQIGKLAASEIYDARIVELEQKLKQELETAANELSETQAKYALAQETLAATAAKERSELQLEITNRDASVATEREQHLLHMSSMEHQLSELLTTISSKDTRIGELTLALEKNNDRLVKQNLLHELELVSLTKRYNDLQSLFDTTENTLTEVRSQAAKDNIELLLLTSRDVDLQQQLQQQQEHIDRCNYRCLRLQSDILAYCNHITSLHDIASGCQHRMDGYRNLWLQQQQHQNQKSIVNQEKKADVCVLQYNGNKVIEEKTFTADEDQTCIGNNENHLPQLSETAATITTTSLLVDEQLVSPPECTEQINNTSVLNEETPHISTVIVPLNDDIASSAAAISQSSVTTDTKVSDAAISHKKLEEYEATITSSTNEIQLLQYRLNELQTESENQKETLLTSAANTRLEQDCMIIALRNELMQCENKHERFVEQQNAANRNIIAEHNNRVKGLIMDLEFEQSKGQRLNAKLAEALEHNSELQNKLRHLQQQQLLYEKFSTSNLDLIQSADFEKTQNKDKLMTNSINSSINLQGSRSVTTHSNMNVLTSTESLPESYRYVQQRQFQETVTALQLQMESVRHINSLVAENIKGRTNNSNNMSSNSTQTSMTVFPPPPISVEDREMQLRAELERKIEIVNERIFQLLAHQQVQQQEEHRQQQQLIIQHQNHNNDSNGAQEEKSNDIDIQQHRQQQQQQQQLYEKHVAQLAEQTALINYQKQQCLQYEQKIASLQKQIAEQKQRIVGKCLSKLARQKERFERETEQMVLLVRQECSDIIAENYALLVKRSLQQQHPHQQQQHVDIDAVSSSSDKNSNSHSLAENQILVENHHQASSSYYDDNNKAERNSLYPTDLKQHQQHRLAKRVHQHRRASHHEQQQQNHQQQEHQQQQQEQEHSELLGQKEDGKTVSEPKNMMMGQISSETSTVKTLSEVTAILANKSSQRKGGTDIRENTTDNTTTSVLYSTSYPQQLDQTDNVATLFSPKHSPMSPQRMKAKYENLKNHNLNQQHHHYNSELKNKYAGSSRDRLITDETVSPSSSSSSLMPVESTSLSSLTRQQQQLSPPRALFNNNNKGNLRQIILNSSNQNNHHDRANISGNSIVGSDNNKNFTVTDTLQHTTLSGESNKVAILNNVKNEHYGQYGLSIEEDRGRSSSRIDVGNNTIPSGGTMTYKNIINNNATANMMRNDGSRSRSSSRSKTASALAGMNNNNTTGNNSLLTKSSDSSKNDNAIAFRNIISRSADFSDNVINNSFITTQGNSKNSTHNSNHYIAANFNYSNHNNNNNNNNNNNSGDNELEQSVRAAIRMQQQSIIANNNSSDNKSNESIRNTQPLSSRFLTSSPLSSSSLLLTTTKAQSSTVVQSPANKIYPEMLSPQQTLQLVQSILGETGNNNNSNGSSNNNNNISFTTSSPGKGIKTLQQQLHQQLQYLQYRPRKSSNQLRSSI